MKLRRCDTQLLRRQAAGLLGETDDPEALVDADLLSCLSVAARVLLAQPRLLEGRQHITRHVQSVGSVMFAPVPALLRSGSPACMGEGTQVMQLVSGAWHVGVAAARICRACSLTRVPRWYHTLMLAVAGTRDGWLGWHCCCPPGCRLGAGG